jgi:hypothetical protein
MLQGRVGLFARFFLRTLGRVATGIPVDFGLYEKARDVVGAEKARDEKARDVVGAGRRAVGARKSIQWDKALGCAWFACGGTDGHAHAHNAHAMYMHMHMHGTDADQRRDGTDVT